MFLEALRLLLMREVRDKRSDPAGLELAWATPRIWLRDGATVAVDDLPTSFGPVSYSIESHLADGYVAVRVTLPAALDSARLHVRLPDGWTASPSLAHPDWDPAANVLLWTSSDDGERRIPVQRVDAD
jgi:hypothetical protein